MTTPSPRERMLAGLPATTRTLDIDGVSTAVIEAGDGPALLARIDVPTTLLWGRHDRMVPLAIGETAATRHGWPLHIIDAAAHAPHIEQPDAFVETLTAIVAVQRQRVRSAVAARMRATSSADMPRPV